MQFYSDGYKQKILDAPRLGPVFFIFMQLLAKISPNNRLAHPWIHHYNRSQISAIHFFGSIYRFLKSSNFWDN